MVIRPPTVTLFRQVLAYLKRKPDRQPATGSLADHEGAAAAAVTLRWGSVLRRPRRPGQARLVRDPFAGDEQDRRPGDGAGSTSRRPPRLAEWIDLCRDEPALYEKLVLRAVAYLPLPKWKVTPTGTQFTMLALAEVREQMARAVPEDRLATVRADAEAHPSRLFSNALMNSAWRNGPVEEIHAGVSKGDPIDRRRITVAEERQLLGSAINRLAIGMEVCRQLAAERPPRSWSEQVIPYGLAEAMLITPSGWTLTEESREVRLARGSPA